jgi:hypothetical protein
VYSQLLQRLNEFHQDEPNQQQDWNVIKNGKSFVSGIYKKVWERKRWKGRGRTFIDPLSSLRQAITSISTGTKERFAAVSAILLIHISYKTAHASCRCCTHDYPLLYHLSY